MTKRQDLVLVVDDDFAVRESLKFSLELEGLAVRACASGAELLAHPDLHAARCLVLDYKMPEMDALEVLAQLAGSPLRLRVILITGFEIGPLQERARAAGIRHVLEKPLSDSALLDCIHEILGHAA